MNLAKFGFYYKLPSQAWLPQLGLERDIFSLLSYNCYLKADDYLFWVLRACAVKEFPSAVSSAMGARDAV